MSAKIRTEHLERTAIVYVRQSTAGQVQDHQESRFRQYALADMARELGFRNVETIDDDLGVSGSGFAERPGFQRLLTAVHSGAVGAVLALEASRLARNDRDWAQLIELGAMANLVLIDHDGIYDPQMVNDRLLLGLKGIMSQFEMATLRQRAHEASKAKARRGELRLPLPVGLVYEPGGAIDLDPNARVQQAIHLVFNKFDELRSLRQVMLWLRREDVSVPVTRVVKGGGGFVEWVSPSYDRVHCIVTNPAYAGAYAYGRTESRSAIVDGRMRKTHGHAKPIDRWEVLIQDHHPGYIDWKRYLRNASILEENAHMKPSTGRKSGRGGRSLLAGLLRCRRCAHKLQVSYGGRNSTTPYFRCARRRNQHGDKSCVSFTSTRTEDVVREQILAAVEGKAIEAAIEASHRIEKKHLARREALMLELEQARYDAQLAARRYDRVDPDMRLVAAELEARWNGALEHVDALEARVKSFDADGNDQKQVDESALRALAKNLPAIWNDESTDMRLKQRIVGILVHEIIADVDDDSKEIVLVIHWRGGRHTELRVARSLSGRTQRCTDDDAIEIVRRMSGRWSDHAIASQLNRLGWQTGTGKNWNAVRLRALRNRLDMPAFDPDETLLTCKQAAQRLGLSPQHLGKLLSVGTIPGTHQIAPGTPWWIDASQIESGEIARALAPLRRRRQRSRQIEDRTLKIPGV
jgi:DNA invertase Pin-like site-specific DNA recombinase